MSESFESKTSESLEAAVWVWRDGIAPLLSVADLECLRDALTRDDSRLLQGATTMPPPMQYAQNWPCEGACALGYIGWQSRGLKTVTEVDEFFYRTFSEAGTRIGGAPDARWFTNWFDDTPRDQMRQELTGWIEQTLAERQVTP